jgi:hypothetical protein
VRGTLFQALSCFSRLFDFGILIWAYVRLWSSRQAGKPLRKICKTPQLSGAGRAPAGSELAGEDPLCATAIPEGTFHPLDFGGLW